MDLKIPPHSIEAEQSVIGAILINNECFDEFGDILTPDMFYGRQLKEYYSAICEMMINGTPIDVISLSDHLSVNLTDIASLAKNCPSSANAKAYALIVREKWIARQVIGAANEIIEDGFKNKKSTDLISAATDKIMKIADSMEQRTEDTSAKAAIDKMIDNIERVMKSGGGLIGISSGIEGLDDITGGFTESNLIVIAARPSMGKTALTTSMCGQHIRDNLNVFYYSAEMASHGLAQRISANMGDVALNKIRNPTSEKYTMDDVEWHRWSMACNDIKKSNMHICDDAGLSVLELDLKIKRYCKKVGKPHVIYVDYLQLMKGNGENRTQEVSSISTGLKALSKKYQCPVIALSQLNRGLESRGNKRPINSDLRESGQVEQDADIIIMLYRDEVYNPETPNKGVAELIITKGRDLAIGTTYAVFNGAKQRFTHMNANALIEEEVVRKRF